jgi:tetratricopeptide (TPR) repeat protein
MNRIRQLIGEIHRRSLWQVLSIYLVGSWVALQVVETITESAGLPDWVQPFALILLTVGLPVVMATAVVQEGVSGKGSDSGVDDSSAEAGISSASPDRAGAAADGPGSEPIPGSLATPGETGAGSAGLAGAGSVAGPPPTPALAGGFHRLLTWRNAISGGVAAFALLGVVVVAYFVMWSTGIGPVGSLAAQGVFEEGDAVVLAQFENTSNDPSLGGMVTEALRVDLAGSSIMTLVEPNRVRDALRRMGRTSEEALDPDLAREVAIRDGFKGVIHGTVGSAGSGYIFVASLTAAESGSVLATFRETARGPDDVIDAIDKLSQSIREKAGESLKVIKSEEPLEDVTTPSLEALRKYAESDRLAELAEYDRAIGLLREALELDPSFAMAYRKLAVLLQNSGGALAEQVEATRRAYELRDRLTERERYLAEAYYHNLVTLDVDAEIRAYESVLERYPDDQAGLNNIALALVDRTRLEEALKALERAVNGPGASAPAFTNYPGYLAMAGRDADARAALARLEARYPGRSIWVAWNHFGLAAFRPDGEGAHRAGEELLALPEAQGRWRAAGTLAQFVGDAQRGRIREAHQHAGESIREMGAAGFWDQVQIDEASRVSLELLLGRKDEARRIREQLDLDRTLDSIPPTARSYEVLIPILAWLGDRDGADHLLRRWEADAIPSSTAPIAREIRRTADALLLGESDPEAALAALNNLSRELNCPGCSLWQRAELAQRAGRYEEAQTHYLATLTTGSGDYFGVPVSRVLAHERLGEVYEALGDSARAADHFATFVEHWAEADPELLARVESARSKAAIQEGS